MTEGLHQGLAPGPVQLEDSQPLNVINLSYSRFAGFTFAVYAKTKGNTGQRGMEVGGDLLLLARVTLTVRGAACLPVRCGGITSCPWQPAGPSVTSISKPLCHSHQR